MATLSTNVHVRDSVVLIEFCELAIVTRAASSDEEDLRRAVEEALLREFAVAKELGYPPFEDLKNVIAPRYTGRRGGTGNPGDAKPIDLPRPVWRAIEKVLGGRPAGVNFSRAA